MSAREEFHRLVDELPDEQVAPIPALVRASTQDQPIGASDAPPRRRKLSITDLIFAEPDLAERSEEILRDEFGRRER